MTNSGALTLEEGEDVIKAVGMTAKEVDEIDKVEACNIELVSLSDTDKLTGCWTLIKDDNVMEVDTIGDTAEELNACDSGSIMKVF